MLLRRVYRWAVTGLGDAVLVAALGICVVVTGCPARSLAPAAVTEPSAGESEAPAPAAPEVVQPAEQEESETKELTEVQHGQASWYGGKHHGRRTASGERFDKNKLTAAHRTLPFGTVVRVTNSKNDKSVVVRINDRGPFGKKRRIIDVSEAAAEKLGMIRSGVVPVTVEVLEKPVKGKRGKDKAVEEAQTAKQ